MAEAKEEFAIIKDEGELGFIDYEDDRSVCNYNPEEEGPVKISIPCPQDGGRPQSINVGERYFLQFTVKNTSSQSVELWKIDIYDSNPKGSFTLSLMEPPSETSDPEYVQRFREMFTLEDRVLPQGQTLNVWLSCKPKEIGLHMTAVHFEVEGDNIERLVFLLAEDHVSQSLASNKPFRRERKPKQENFYHQKSVPGAPPPRTSNRTFKNKLPMYAIPRNIRELLEAKQIPDSIRIGLTKDNYSPFFSTLMIMEEIKLEEVMRAYDMENISFRKKGQFLTLEVPGLAERRPSLVYGDFILVKLIHQDVNVMTRPCQGHIHRVEAEEVFLRFGDEFYRHHKPGSMYNVQFTYNRANMRRTYQAVRATESLGIDFLFPSESEQIRLIDDAHVPCMPLTLNEEQKLSVRKVLGCRGGPPYIIYGPPGTGKTVTLVEAIFQLYTQHRNSRILFCAPSNSAADHALELLLSLKGSKINLSDIFRMNAIARPFEDIKPDILKFCFYVDGEFKCPPLRKLQSFRIIFCTYMTSSTLYAEGIQRGHFSHIFLDEAGQASEPETMVPLSHLCLRRTVVVLAGDPKQLGPVIHSKEAEDLGLGMSFLERLFECVYYDGGNINYVTELVRNYRCHPDILHLPSKLFYRGELIACKRNPGFDTSSLDFLSNKDFPILYIGIQGCDEREGTNPSWFNRFEASKVVEIIRILKGKNVVKPEEIGVITPYRQQVLKINKALESFDCSDVKVGSVEQFQGQEKEVIIISTVRSTIKYNEFDITHCLGFLSNPKRFNVAITRAKSLMVVIGNPHITSKDSYWNTLLWYCVDAGAYQGCILPERQQTILEDPSQVEDLDYEEEQDQFEESESGEDLSSSHRGSQFPEMTNLISALPNKTTTKWERKESNRPCDPEMTNLTSALPNRTTKWERKESNRPCSPEMTNLMSALPNKTTKWQRKESNQNQPHDPVPRPAVELPDNENSETYNGDGFKEGESYTIPKPVFNEDEWEDGWKL